MFEFCGPSIIPGPGLLALIVFGFCPPDPIIPGPGLRARIGWGLAALGIPGAGLLDLIFPFSRVPGLEPWLVLPLGVPYELCVPQFSVRLLISLLVNAGWGTPNAGALPPLLEPSYAGGGVPRCAASLSVLAALSIGGLAIASGAGV